MCTNENKQQQWETHFLFSVAPRIFMCVEWWWFPYINLRTPLEVQGFLLTQFYFVVGEVELENLPLKKDALSHFGLPIRAYSGSIGKIKLQVPVRQFRSAPWCINIEKVYIICGPVNLEDVSQQCDNCASLLTCLTFVVGWQRRRTGRPALQASIPRQLRG